MFRLSRWLCQENVFVLIFGLVQHVAPLCFAAATGTNISHSMGKHHRPVLSVSFLDVYHKFRNEINP